MFRKIEFATNIISQKADFINSLSGVLFQKTYDALFPCVVNRLKQLAGNRGERPAVRVVEPQEDFVRLQQNRLLGIDERNVDIEIVYVFEKRVFKRCHDADSVDRSVNNCARLDHFRRL